MKALICELCGDTNLIKQDGMFVCQSCGGKYTVEEAKKMMVEGTVVIDESSKVDAYYEMAINAYSGDNKVEAEVYCNKILEVQPNNYKAWLLKGKASGWQTTLANVRLNEAVNCFVNALVNAPEDEIEDIKNDISSELIHLNMAYLSLYFNNYIIYINDYENENIFATTKMILDLSYQLLTKCGYNTKKINDIIGMCIKETTDESWLNVITKEYRHQDHPDKYVWTVFVKRCFRCMSTLELAAKIIIDTNTKIQSYFNLICITQALVCSCSYTTGYGGYTRESCLNKVAKNRYIDQIMTYHQKIHELNPNYVIPSRPKSPR